MEKSLSELKNLEILAGRLYSMELFEEFAPDNFHIILRVPGGWVVNGNAFVPYDNEFQTRYRD